MNSGLHTGCKSPRHAVLCLLWPIIMSEVKEKMLVRSKCSNIFSLTWLSLFCTCCVSVSKKNKHFHFNFT